MVLLKCSTQYFSRFEKFSSDHRTKNGQLSFQSQRMAMTKKVQTIIELCLFYMLAKLYSKPFKLGFNIMWTKNFQVYKLGFKEEEEPEIKLPTFTESRKRQGSSRKTSPSALLITAKPLAMWITANWKVLKEGSIRPPYCLQRNLCVGQEATELDMKQLTGSKMGKTSGKTIFSPCLFNLYAYNIIWNAGLDESQAGIKIARKNINNLRCTIYTTLMAESEKELKRLLMRLKEENEKSGLKLSIKKRRSWHLVPSLHGK